MKTIIVSFKSARQMCTYLPKSDPSLHGLLTPLHGCMQASGLKLAGTCSLPCRLLTYGHSVTSHVKPRIFPDSVLPPGVKIVDR